MSLVRISDGTKLSFNIPSNITPIEYPWDKFKEIKTRPVLTVYTSNPEVSYSDLCVSVLKFLEGGTVGIRVIVHFLYRFCLKEMKQTMGEDWKSYGITIPAGDITPISFLHVNLKTGLEVITSGDGGTPCEDESLWLATAILCCYRAGATNPGGQIALRAKLSSALNTVVRSQSFQEEHNISYSTIGDKMKNNDDLDVLVSAIDLFLTNYPRHPCHTLKTGSIVTRYSGATGLMNYNYLRKKMGLPTSMDLARWILAPGSAEEIEQVFALRTPPEETDKVDSYFPYHMGLKLSRRSPYSARANPITHAIIHIAGCLLGNSRSKNAVISVNDVSALVAINGAILFFASKVQSGLYDDKLKADDVKKVREQRKQERDAKRKEKNQGPSEEMIQIQQEELDPSNPILKTPKQWLNYLEDHNQTFTLVHKRKLQQAINGVRDTRNGSVGEFVKDNLMTLLTFEEE